LLRALRVIRDVVQIREMKKHTYRYLTIVVGFTLGLSACTTPKPEVKIQINSEHLTELTWGDIEPMLLACALRGLCDVEINGFLFELPTTHHDGEGRDDDPLFIQHTSYQNDRRKLVLWSSKHANDVVNLFFGEMVDFNVVKDVITTLQEHGIDVRIMYNKDATSIHISLYGSFQTMHNQKLDPTVKTPVESGNEQGTAGHP